MGFGILRRLAGREDAPPVLVLTGFVNAAVVAECAKLGAAYFIPKPCDTAALMQCLRQCAKAGGKSPAAAAAPAPVPARLESAVTDVLHEIGVPAHVKGYQYLREGILFTIRDADSTAGITKALYPTVAKKFSATPSCVERSMRHAIDIAWNRGDEDVQEKIFCGAFSGSTGRLHKRRIYRHDRRAFVLQHRQIKNTESSRKTGRHLQRIDRRPVHRGKNIHARLPQK